MSNEDQIDLIFKALANPVRRAICDELKLRPLTTKQICMGFPDLDRTTVMQHLKVLESAGLLIPVRKGRERFNYLDAMPIERIHQRWIGPHAAAATSALARLKRDLEEGAKDKLSAS
ncbi:ArsR/SmtB family transcription factor [Pontixanthobacter aquaemixtae]|uniref:Helix-turn-helix domain-containing protein n=1 Tax=Pontixanthobacter aquaemixtae TaxID=1958940 RepID=A0A844ZPQ9_9SPHN|nr:helix-turn-helix domain-containing protein [Pontixanthobacter aquaemixtae]MXO89728.1 helix-turn-helix domain-containing protein [Pontixanthobacter aquaemixtae]